MAVNELRYLLYLTSFILSFWFYVLIRIVLIIVCQTASNTIPVNNRISHNTQCIHSIHRSVSNMPSVLWCCWLGGRKGIQPVKKLRDGVLVWLSVWGEVQICIWPRWCHCHSQSLDPANPDWFYLSGICSPRKTGQRAVEWVLYSMYWRCKERKQALLASCIPATDLYIKVLDSEGKTTNSHKTAGNSSTNAA